MTSVMSLTAGLVVLTLLCCLPMATRAVNPYMKLCNVTAMQHLQSLDLDSFSGRWYVSHFTTAARPVPPPAGIAVDVQTAIPPAQDKTGLQNQTFVVFRFTKVYSNGICVPVITPYEEVNGKLSGPYLTQFLNSPMPHLIPSGYYINWYNAKVLATDYNSTAVVLLQFVAGGQTDNSYTSEIQMWVRDPAVAPDADLINTALTGVCHNNFLNLASGRRYWAVPNSSTAACFAATV